MSQISYLLLSISLNGLPANRAYHYHIIKKVMSEKLNRVRDTTCHEIFFSHLSFFSGLPASFFIQTFELLLRFLALLLLYCEISLLPTVEFAISSEKRSSFLSCSLLPFSLQAFPLAHFFREISSCFQFKIALPQKRSRLFSLHGRVAIQFGQPPIFVSDQMSCKVFLLPSGNPELQSVKEKEEIREGLIWFRHNLLNRFVGRSVGRTYSMEDA